MPFRKIIMFLEHVNLTVSDSRQSAASLERIFGWHVRWEGEALLGGLNHIGIVVDDRDGIEFEVVSYR